MALVRIVKNPIQPFNVEERIVKDGQTIRSALKELYTESFVEFTAPTIITVNGRSMMRDQWDIVVLNESDVMGVVTMSAEPITIFFAVVAVISLGISLYTMSQMRNMNGFDAPAPDPTYSLSGQKNDFRLMEPIEVNYGRNRVWCTYAAKPFNRFISNDQWLYQLFCVGQGEYQINQLFIEDTVISNYQDVEYEIIPPNQKVTLIETNVETSPEVRDIELFGPNEEDYTVAGPFTVVSPNRRTKKIEIDLTLPSGLYYTGDKGLESRTVNAEFEYRAIDDTDTPIGDWQVLFTWTQTWATTTPQRFTIITDVPEGRYQVRGRRTNDKDSSYRAGNTLKWDSARSIIPDDSTYGNVTLLAVKAKATNNLNNESSARVNVDCTRLLKTRSNGVWSGLVPTRSIAWAFYDIVTNPIYGAALPEEYVDIDELERLDGELSAEGRFFDGILRNKTTVWDALNTVAKIARARATINGTMITMVRDKPKTIPQGVFTVDNIVEGSFEWEISMWDPTEADSVEVTYVDPITYLQESMNCKVVESDGLNPEKVDLVGCTDRNIAYRDGMYIAMCKMYKREAIKFKTGLEGILPMYGDLIAVQYPIPSFGQSSVIYEMYDNLIILEDEMVWTASQQHFVMIRGDNGVGYGPYPVTRGTSDDMLVLSAPIDINLRDGNREPPIVSFGGSTTFARLCIVEEIAPEGGELVQVSCTNYDPIVFSHDSDMAPPIELDDVQPLPDIPVVRNLNVVKIPEMPDTISVSWDPALGATSYLLEKSQDGENWSTVANINTTSWQLQVFKGMLYLRVSGIGAGRGPWTNWSGEVGDAMGVPQSVGEIGVVQDFKGTGFSIDWNSVIIADKYKIEVYEGLGSTLARQITTTTPSFTYNYEMAKTDNKVARQYVIRVFAVNGYGESPSSSILMTNPVPLAPIDVTHALTSTEPTYKVYRISWSYPNPPSDLAGYKVYISDTSGFTPSESNLEFDGVSLGVSHPINTDSNGKHPAKYYRVGSYDIWGEEVSLSAEFTIPAVV
ncbi:putative tail protein [Acinetobacter phage DMU1]|nr:putative tail protein [Acinetobacter phage DMU1]